MPEEPEQPVPEEVEKKEPEQPTEQKATAEQEVNALKFEVKVLENALREVQKNQEMLANALKTILEKQQQTPAQQPSLGGGGLTDILGLARSLGLVGSSEENTGPWMEFYKMYHMNADKVLLKSLTRLMGGATETVVHEVEPAF